MSVCKFKKYKHESDRICGYVIEAVFFCYATTSASILLTIVCAYYVWPFALALIIFPFLAAGVTGISCAYRWDNDRAKREEEEVLRVLAQEYREDESHRVCYHCVPAQEIKSEHDEW